MRTPFTAVLVLVILLTSSYLYQQVEAVCKIPLSYRVGYIDNRFDISRDEVRLAIADAESVWEEATGKNLFTYDDRADFVVNFVFDDRQAFAEAEEDFREKLDVTEDVNSVIGKTYNELVSTYDAREQNYKIEVAVYEKSLAAYNAKVQKYNDEGGAPPEAFDALQAEKKALDSATTKINALGSELNALAKEINRLSEKGNELVEVYNENVDRYNNTFGESHEFTQGDYQGNEINIYKFIDRTELVLVLAHELGHALSLDHVEGSESIMYHLMGEQPASLELTGSDISEFERVCGDSTSSLIERIKILFRV